MLQSIPPYVAQAYHQTGIAFSVDVSGRQNNNTDPVPPVQPVSESVSVSEEGASLSRRNGQSEEEADQSTGDPEGRSTASSGNDEAAETASLQKLQARDLEVRAHEQAHLAAAGQYAAGGASFVYKRGPDGRLYAVGGEVQIDVGKESTAQATIAKMQTVRRAALAPANPSSADRQIASQASIRLAEAQQEMRMQQSERLAGPFSDAENHPTTQPSLAEDQPAIAVSSVANRRALMVETYKAVNELL